MSLYQEVICYKHALFKIHKCKKYIFINSLWILYNAFWSYLPLIPHLTQFKSTPTHVSNLLPLSKNINNPSIYIANILLCVCDHPLENIQPTKNHTLMENWVYLPWEPSVVHSSSVMGERYHKILPSSCCSIDWLNLW